MPLQDVTFKTNRNITAKSLSKSAFISKGIKTNKRRFEACIRRIDDLLNKLKPSKKSQLVWTSCGALLGNSSSAPHCDIRYIWDYAIELFPDEKSRRKFVGTLLMWRIASRDEDWLTFREDTKRIDDVTGEIIQVFKYWIDNRPKPTIMDLVAKFNGHRA